MSRCLPVIKQDNTDNTFNHHEMTKKTPSESSDVILRPQRLFFRHNAVIQSSKALRCDRWSKSRGGRRWHCYFQLGDMWLDPALSVSPVTTRTTTAKKKQQTNSFCFFWTSEVRNAFEQLSEANREHVHVPAATVKTRYNKKKSSSKNLPCHFWLFMNVFFLLFSVFVFYSYLRKHFVSFSSPRGVRPAGRRRRKRRSSPRTPHGPRAAVTQEDFHNLSVPFSKEKNREDLRRFTNMEKHTKTLRFFFATLFENKKTWEKISIFCSNKEKSAESF